MITATSPATKALFVTGTDTGVGKTFVCAALWRYLLKRGVKAGYQKWVSTGGADLPDDLRQCLATAGLPLARESLDYQVPYRFRLPASPHLAAESEGCRIDPEVILARFHHWAGKHDLLLVEGVGGLLVPLNRELLLADLLARLQPPTLIVARSGLGTLNHTLLTLEALRARRIPVLGVVFSDATVQDADELLVNDNLRTIAEMGNVRVFGRIRHGEEATAETVCRDIAVAMKMNR
jgi:dethiobiotin synthetase